MDSPAHRNVLLIGGALVLALLWFRRRPSDSIPASVSNALNLPAPVAATPFAPTYLTYNLPQFTQSPTPVISFTPADQIVKPLQLVPAVPHIKPIGRYNPSGPYPSCGCGCDGKDK